MKTDFSYPSADGKNTVHAIEWKPEGEIKAILQISHGMTSHIGRWGRFAEYLNGFGILVTGNDHLGHGLTAKNAEDLGFFGHPDGNAHVIADLHELRRQTQEKYPGVPYFMLGHSMGSFLIRQYAMLHGDGLAGVVVMGTGSQPGAVLAAGKAVCRVLALFAGWRHRSNLVNAMAFGSYTKAIPNARTHYDWLTKENAVVDAYLADPLCGYVFTLNGFYQMFSFIGFIQKKENIDRIPKDLPLLLVSGGADPVGDFGRGVETARDGFTAAGITDVEMILYPDDRHEILNETDGDKVREDIKNWMTARLPAEENR